MVVSWFKDSTLTLFLRQTEQPATDIIDYRIGVFAYPSFWKEVGMLGYETDDIVLAQLGWLETSHTVGTDNELVTTDAATFII